MFPQKVKFFGLYVLILLTLASSCQTNRGKTYTKAEVKKIVDSTIKANMGRLKKQYKRDLELRQPIETKVKRDSILGIDTVLPVAPVLNLNNWDSSKVKDYGGKAPGYLPNRGTN